MAAQNDSVPRRKKLAVSVFCEKHATHHGLESITLPNDPARFQKLVVERR